MSLQEAFSEFLNCKYQSDQDNFSLLSSSTKLLFVQYRTCFQALKLPKFILSIHNKTFLQSDFRNFGSLRYLLFLLHFSILVSQLIFNFLNEIITCKCRQPFFIKQKIFAFCFFHRIKCILKQCLDFNNLYLNCFPVTGIHLTNPEYFTKLFDQYNSSNLFHMHIQMPSNYTKRLHFSEALTGTSLIQFFI